MEAGYYLYVKNLVTLKNRKKFILFILLDRCSNFILILPSNIFFFAQIVQCTKSFVSIFLYEEDYKVEWIRKTATLHILCAFQIFSMYPLKVFSCYHSVEVKIVSLYKDTSNSFILRVILMNDMNYQVSS